MWGNPVTVVNRTSKVLSYVFDGISYDLQPGNNPGIPESLAGFAKNKFPAMGTEDPYNPQSFICLIGVKEWGDDVTKLEQTKAVERLDRSKMGADARKAVAGPQVTWKPMPAENAGNHVVFAGGEGTA